VAGETLDQALAVARKLNAEGITVTLDHLGESVSTLEEAAEARDVYLRTLDAIHAFRHSGQRLAQAHAVRPRSFRGQCLANVDRLVRPRRRTRQLRPRGYGIQRVYRSHARSGARTLHARHGAVGVVIQSYLYRSQERYRKAVRAKIRVRLCKGAYLEPAAVAFPARAMWTGLPRTHPLSAAERALIPPLPPTMRTSSGRPAGSSPPADSARCSFEFQMLYGIRRDLQRRLVAEGYRLRLYVPFGKAWYPYYMRRLAERPANVFFMLRNLFRLSGLSAAEWTPNSDDMWAELCAPGKDSDRS
jgi:proline dehydrogenase